MGPADSSVHFFVVVAAAAIGASLAVVMTIFGIRLYDDHQAVAETGAYAETYQSGAACNVLGIQIHGTVVGSRSEIPVSDILLSNDGANTLITPNYTVASDVIYYLENAEADPNIKAIMLDVDSGGGDGQAGEEIAIAVQAVGKPSVALIHGLGLSTAYLVASAADKVFSYKTSSVGSIGATYSFINLSEKNKKDGIKYEALSSGPFKDMFSPDKPLTEEERELIERDLEALHENFVIQVAANRRQPYEKIQALADGSSVLGTLALENALVDGLGGSREANNYLAEAIGEPISFCWQ